MLCYFFKTCGHKWELWRGAWGLEDYIWMDFQLFISEAFFKKIGSSILLAAFLPTVLIKALSCATIRMTITDLFEIIQVSSYTTQQC